VDFWVECYSLVMKDFKGNMIFTSHHHEIMQTAGNRIVEITPNGIIDQLMTFDDYIRSDKVKEMRKKLYKNVKVKVKA